MKKFMNVRFPVILACSLAAGIAAGYAFVHNNIDTVWTVAAIIPAAILSITLTLIKRSLKPALFVLLSLVLLFAGAFMCMQKLNTYAAAQHIADGETLYSISGKVSKKGETAYGEYIVVTRATVNGNVRLEDGDIIVYLSSAYGEFCDIDYDVTFFSQLTQLDLFPYGELNYNVQNNVKYSCNVLGGLKSKYNFSLFGSLRKEIKSALFKNLDNETAAICFGMLTGNTDSIEESSLENFRYGGIAHIFAVSGLHIGIVFGIVGFICKRLHANKYITAILCVFAVFFYAGICGFTLSSLRAAIMCTVATATKLAYVKYDGLNSLSLAVIIILFISPLSLFSVGFKLSVCAVGGIFIFTKLFSSPLRKIKIPRKIADSVCLSFAAQTGTLPVSLVNFGYLSGAGILLNVIVVPIVSALFIVLLLGTVFCAIITAAAPYVLPVAVAPLEALISFLISAGFESAAIRGFGAGLFVVLYYVGVLFISDKLNLKAFSRTIFALCAVIIVAAYFLGATYSPFDGYKIIVTGYGGSGNVIVKSSSGSVLIVTDDANKSRTLQNLNNFYCSNLQAVIIVGGEDCAMKYSSLGINCKNVFVCSKYIPVQPYGEMKINYEREFTVCGAYYCFTDGYTLNAELGGVRVRICSGETPQTQNCDLLVSRNAAENYDFTNAVYFGTKNHVNSIYRNGTFTYFANGGKLSIS